MIWNWFKDRWIVSRQAGKLFLISALIALAMTPIFFGAVDTERMSFWPRLPWALLSIVGPVAVLFLWFGMWRYWFQIDRSARWIKRLWFVILLVGFWWGSCLYCFFVYLPQVFRRASIEASRG